MSAARVGEFSSDDVVRLVTPALAPAMQHWQQRLGFTLVQSIPGVWAWLRCGAFHVQLWQHTADEPEFEPVYLRVVVRDVFHLHSRLAYQASPRLTEVPQCTSMGSWEFGLTDGDGNHLQLIEWPEQTDYVRVARALAARSVHAARLSSNSGNPPAASAC